MLDNEYTEEFNNGNEYAATDMQLFEERRNRRLSGESKTHTWGDAKKIITGKTQEPDNTLYP